MSYSCTMVASYVLEAIQARFGKEGESSYSNRLANGGFHERGKENKDGAITGTIYMPVKDAEKAALGFVYKAGSFRIEPTGKITRIYQYAKELCTRERNEHHTNYLFKNIEN